MKITAVNRDDLFDIAELEYEVFGDDGFGVFILENYLRKAVVFDKILGDDGKILGYIITVPLTKSDFLDYPARVRTAIAPFLEFTAHIVNFLVDIPYRERGLGTRLLLHNERKLIEQGFSAAVLEVRIDNRPAISLYRKFGFRKIGKIRKYYNSGNDAYVMLKKFVYRGLEQYSRSGSPFR